MNSYASLGALKAELGKTNTDDDAVLLRLLVDASREADRRVPGRVFYATTATRYYAGGGRRRLVIHDDLVSVTTLKVDANFDDTYELTLVASTDYFLAPYNRLSDEPATAIDLNPNSTQLGVWPVGPRAVEIVGVFGYSAETEASGTLGAAITDAAATSVTMTASHGLTGGETIYIGSEQLYVSSVSTNTLTVVRGVNGTTAATHSNSAAVTRRRYHRNAERAVIVRAADMWRGVQAGYSQVGDGTIGYSGNVPYAQFTGLLRPLRPVYY